MQFTCYEKKCPYDGKGSYILTLPPEACVDVHNCATFFCPHCNKELTKIERSLNESETYEKNG